MIRAGSGTVRNSPRGRADERGGRGAHVTWRWTTVSSEHGESLQTLSLWEVNSDMMRHGKQERKQIDSFQRPQSRSLPVAVHSFGSVRLPISTFSCIPSHLEACIHWKRLQLYTPPRPIIYCLYHEFLDPFTFVLNSYFRPSWSFRLIYWTPSTLAEATEECPGKNHRLLEDGRLTA